MYPEISSSEEDNWYRTSLIFPNKLFQTLEQGVCVQTACWSGSWAPAAKPCPGMVQGKSLSEWAKIMPENITGVNDDAPVPRNLLKHALLHWDRCRPCHFSLRGTLLLTSCTKPFDFRSVNSFPSVAKIMTKRIWEPLVPKWVSGYVRSGISGAIWYCWRGKRGRTATMQTSLHRNFSGTPQEFLNSWKLSKKISLFWQFLALDHHGYKTPYSCK